MATAITPATTTDQATTTTTALHWEDAGTGMPGDQEAVSARPRSYWSIGPANESSPLDGPGAWWLVELVTVDEAGTELPYGVDLGRYADEDAAKDAAQRWEDAHTSPED